MPVLPTYPVSNPFAVNKTAHGRHLHTVEVAGSNPAAPTIFFNYIRSLPESTRTTPRGSLVCDIRRNRRDSFRGDVPAFELHDRRGGGILRHQRRQRSRLSRH